jgi:hypothetical protein
MLMMIAQDTLGLQSLVPVAVAELEGSEVEIPTLTVTDGATLSVQNPNPSTTVEFGTTSFNNEASVNMEDGSIKVPFGEFQLINCALLKSLGPATAMVLFPNFPLEIRQKIYDYDVEGTVVRIKLLDVGHNWCGESFVPADLAAASKEALQYMKAKYGYMPVFSNGTTMYSPQLDLLLLKLVQAVNMPAMAIAPKVTSSTILDGISSVTFEICNFQHGVQWIQNNLVGMTGLKKLAIHGFFPTAGTGQAQVSLYVTSEDISNNRKEYQHCLEKKDGSRHFGFAAMVVIGESINDQNQQQGILDLWMLMDRCLKNPVRFPSFPKTVVMGFHWN